MFEQLLFFKQVLQDYQISMFDKTEALQTIGIVWAMTYRRDQWTVLHAFQ